MTYALDFWGCHPKRLCPETRGTLFALDLCLLPSLARRIMPPPSPRSRRLHWMRQSRSSAGPFSYRRSEGREGGPSSYAKSPPSLPPSLLGGRRALLFFFLAPLSVVPPRPVVGEGGLPPEMPTVHHCGIEQGACSADSSPSAQSSLKIAGSVLGLSTTGVD